MEDKYLFSNSTVPLLGLRANWSHFRKALTTNTVQSLLLCTTGHVLTKSSGHQRAANSFFPTEKADTPLCLVWHQTWPLVTAKRVLSWTWTSTKICLNIWWHRCILHKRTCSYIHRAAGVSANTHSPRFCILADCIQTTAAGQVTRSLSTMWLTRSLVSLRESVSWDFLSR